MATSPPAEERFSPPPSRAEKWLPLFIPLTSFAFFICLYLFRSFDDNRLTSWESVFAHMEAGRVMAIFIGAAALSIFLSVLRFPLRRRSLFLFLLSYAIALPLWSEPEVIVDASRYFTEAKHLAVYGIGFFFRSWGAGIDAWTDMPLLPLIYGLIFKVFGEQRILIQAANTAFYAGSVVLTSHIGRRLWDEDTGFFGGLMLLGVPFLITQAPLMLVDVPTMFFFLLSVLTFLGALDRGGWMIAAAGLSLVLAFFTKYSIAMMLSIHAVVLLVLFIEARPPSDSLSTGRSRRLYAVRALQVAIVAAVGIGLVVALKQEVFLTQIRLLMEYQGPGLRRWGESNLSTFFFQTHPFIPILAAGSALTALKRRDPRFVITAWLVVLVLVLRIRRIRYVIMVFPMLCLMASYGLMRLGSVRAVRAAVTTVVVFSLALALFVYLPFLRKISTVNLVAAGDFVDGIGKGEVRVETILPDDPVMNPAVAVPLLDFSMQRHFVYDYDAAAYRQPWESIATSPLRFTWRYQNPSYYRQGRDSQKLAALVVIANSTDAALPSRIKAEAEAFSKKKVFSVSEGVFQFQTLVSVWYN